MDSGEGKFPQHSLKIKDSGKRGGVPVASAALVTLALTALAVANLAARPASLFWWTTLIIALVLVGVIFKGEIKGRR